MTTDIAGLVADLRASPWGDENRNLTDIMHRAADALENMPRTVIVALREPTEAMMQAGCASNPPGKYHADTKLSEIILAEWQAMIDEALKGTAQNE
jgi:hypothetical protein